MKHFRRLGFILVAGIMGCGPEHVTGVDSPTGATPIPVMTSAADCGEARSYNICDWLGSTDAVVWGTVTRVAMPDDLMVMDADGSYPWTASCSSGVVSPGLLVEIEVLESFRGDLSGHVEVRVGSEQLRHFSPQPVRATGGDVEWTGGDAALGSALEVGQEIGLVLHYVEAPGVWSISGEPFFGIDREGAMVFGTDGNECSSALTPSGAVGLTFSSFAAEAARCRAEPSTAALTRERMMAELWGWGESGTRNPSRYCAGVCYLPEVPPEGCGSDADCGPGELCSEGACTAN
jgi:hypothetical protein